MPKIFISYRRSDSLEVSRALYQALMAEFGEANVFLDEHSIAASEHFLAAIEEFLVPADVLLVVIGTTWLSTTDDAGNQRLFVDDDYVRGEIETGLRHYKRIATIPVLVNGATMPKAEELPPSIYNLSFINGRNLRPDSFDDDLKDLIATIRKLKPEQPAPAPPMTTVSTEKQRVPPRVGGMSQGGLILGAVMVAVLLLFGGALAAGVLDFGSGDDDENARQTEEASIPSPTPNPSPSPSPQTEPSPTADDPTITANDESNRLDTIPRPYESITAYVLGANCAATEGISWSSRVEELLDDPEIEEALNIRLENGTGDESEPFSSLYFTFSCNSENLVMEVDFGPVRESSLGYRMAEANGLLMVCPANNSTIENMAGVAAGVLAYFNAGYGNAYHFLSSTTWCDESPLLQATLYLIQGNAAQRLDFPADFMSGTITGNANAARDAYEAGLAVYERDIESFRTSDHEAFAALARLHLNLAQVEGWATDKTRALALIETVLGPQLDEAPDMRRDPQEIYALAWLNYSYFYSAQHDLATQRASEEAEAMCERLAFYDPLYSQYCRAYLAYVDNRSEMLNEAGQAAANIRASEALSRFWRAAGACDFYTSEGQDVPTGRAELEAGVALIRDPYIESQLLPNIAFMCEYEVDFGP